MDIRNQCRAAFDFLPGFFWPGRRPCTCFTSPVSHSRCFQSLNLSHCQTTSGLIRPSEFDLQLSELCSLQQNLPALIEQRWSSSHPPPPALPRCRGQLALSQMKNVMGLFSCVFHPHLWDLNFTILWKLISSIFKGTEKVIIDPQWTWSDIFLSVQKSTKSSLKTEHITWWHYCSI